MNDTLKNTHDADSSSADKRTTHDDLFDVKVMIQPTPNPDAFKFIVNREVKARGNVSYNNAEECHNNELARSIFSVESVEQVYFFENVITVTFAPAVDLLAAEDKIIQLIKEKILGHDPTFKVEGDEGERRAKLPPELQKIEEILDRTIRPYLQGDGGDIEVVSLVDGQLAVRYQGACGSCPSSTMGTLMGIESILREEFDPDIEVIPV